MFKRVAYTDYYDFYFHHWERKSKKYMTLYDTRYSYVRTWSSDKKRVYYSREKVPVKDVKFKIIFIKPKWLERLVNKFKI